MTGRPPREPAPDLMILRRDALDMASRQLWPQTEYEPDGIQELADATIMLANRYADYIRHGTPVPPVEMDIGRTPPRGQDTVPLSCGHEITDVDARSMPRRIRCPRCPGATIVSPKPTVVPYSCGWPDYMPHDSHVTAEDQWCPGVTCESGRSSEAAAT